MAKRVFDIVFSLVALIVLSVPMALIALWVKLDSPGGVLFRQTRVGLHGREFRILKFRTMHAGAEKAGPQLTAAADPRITRAGRVLRRYKLDELPQFFNVLAGHMSVVGPRPEVPRYVALYPPDVRAVVLSVRPGITDPASIAFHDESSLLDGAEDSERVYIEKILPAKLRLYQNYVRQRSFLGDLVVILRTLRLGWTTLTR